MNRRRRIRTHTVLDSQQRFGMEVKSDFFIDVPREDSSSSGSNSDSDSDTFEERFQIKDLTFAKKGNINNSDNDSGNEDRAPKTGVPIAAEDIEMQEDRELDEEREELDHMVDWNLRYSKALKK